MPDPIPSTPEGSRPQPRYRGRRFEQGADESFRKVSTFAVTSFVLGLLTFLTMFDWSFLFLPVVSIVCGLIALKQIQLGFGELTGRGLAIAGLSCSVVLWILGIFVSAFFFSDVPTGYTVIEWAELQPDKKSNELLPSKIFELEGKYVYIRGYMYPERQSASIQQFILVPTTQHCRFCARDLESTEMLQVKMSGDLLAQYTIQEIGVGGILKIDRNEILKPLGGFPYVLEANYLYQP